MDSNVRASALRNPIIHPYHRLSATGSVHHAAANFLSLEIECPVRSRIGGTARQRRRDRRRGDPNGECRRRPTTDPAELIRLGKRRARGAAVPVGNGSDFVDRTRAARIGIRHSTPPADQRSRPRTHRFDGSATFMLLDQGSARCARMPFIPPWGVQRGRLSTRKVAGQDGIELNLIQIGR